MTALRGAVTLGSETSKRRRYKSDVKKLARPERELYDTVADERVLGRLRAAGWFPFVEIVTSEFGELANAADAEFDLQPTEEKILGLFSVIEDGRKAKPMTARWRLGFVEDAQELSEAAGEEAVQIGAEAANVLAQSFSAKRPLH